MACSASFCLAILDSIGDANHLAISDPHTNTLHLSPRDITIIAMTLLHGTMTGAEVDALRQPLKKKLSTVSDLPSHIVAFRGVLVRLETALLRLMGSVCSSPSPFSTSTRALLFTVTNEAIVQQTFETYAACIIPQLHNILAHSNPRPFAGNVEGASEDDVMGGRPNLPYPNLPSIPHRQLDATLLPSTTLIPSAILTTPPWPWFLTLSLPHGQWFLSMHNPSTGPSPCPFRQERF
jgi:hypothetical protein